MAHPRETRHALRAAYLGGLPIEQASIKAGVALATARRWKADALAEGDDWDKFVRASLMAAGGGFDAAMGRVAQGVILRCEALLERIAADAEIDPVEATKAVGSLTDSLAKAHAASKRLMPATDRLAVSMSVIKSLAAFIAERYPQHTAAFAEVLEPFGREVLSDQG
ncbi:MAG: DUF1804 family protein [Burkholderiaceae bacterium]|nr:DUF1804 family protein [Burkholderiaceae bacterium]